MSREVITNENANFLQRSASLPQYPTAFAISPSARYVACGQSVQSEPFRKRTKAVSWTNAAVEIVDRTGAKPPLSLPTTRAGRGWVYSLDYSADGTNLAYVYSDGIYLWDLKAMSLILKWPHPEFVASRLPLEFIVVQGKERLYCMDADRLTVYEDCLWSSPTGFFVDQVWPHQSDIRFSPHGERIAVCTNAGNHGKVEIWNLEMYALELEIGRDTFVGSGLAFHPVEKLLAFAVGSTVQLVRFPGGKQQTELRLPKNVDVSHLEFSPNGKVLAMSCRRYSELRWCRLRLKTDPLYV